MGTPFTNSEPYPNQLSEVETIEYKKHNAGLRQNRIAHRCDYLTYVSL